MDFSRDYRAIPELDQYDQAELADEAEPQREMSAVSEESIAVAANSLQHSENDARPSES